MPESVKVLEELTDRECEVLRLVVNGDTNTEIADQLCITIRTVRFHMNNIYSKLGQVLAKPTRPNLIRWAIKEANL